MALVQTLALARNILLSTPTNPLTHTHMLSFTPDPSSSLRLFSSSAAAESNKNRRPGNLSLRCSMDYNSNTTNNSNGYYDNGSVGPPWPRPSEIQWKKELCNSVQLIGIVAAPVQTKQLNSGKALAWSRLAVKKSSTDTTWINLTFWDELAHVASQHIEKGQQIYVSGRLISDTVEGEDGKEQTYYKVVVQQLNFVERNFSPVPLYDGDPSSEMTGKKLGNYALNSTGSTQELWQAFFANPVDWWDNRKNKRNPKYPDFKHKDTGEALWIEGRYNPSWVKSQLAILDSRMETFHHQNDANLLPGDHYASF